MHPYTPIRLTLASGGLLVLSLAAAAGASPGSAPGQHKGGEPWMGSPWEGPGRGNICCCGTGCCGGEVPDPWKGDGWNGGSDGPPPIDFPSEGVRLRAWIPLHEFGNSSRGSDVWGYVSPSGREYAVFGLSHGTGFVDVTTPDHPEVVGFIEGPISVWRDMKVHGHHAYVVTEGSSDSPADGIQVIDLSEIDSGTVTLVGNITEAGHRDTLRTHNLAHNEDTGLLARCGGGTGTIGIRLYQIPPDNHAEPKFVGEWHDRYVHDAQIVTWEDGPFAGRQILFAASNRRHNRGNPGLDILDVTDPENIEHLGFTSYSWPRFSHQVWISECRQYAYLNDELAEIEYDITTTTRIIDISDLTDPFEAATYTNNNTSTAHNLYIRGDLLFTANYYSGLRVFDISNRLEPEEIAYFDVRPETNETGFDGLWGTYPYLPSGVVLGSDIEKGLFIWTVDALRPTPPCIADWNEDGEVDINDFFIFLTDFENELPKADLNEDGEVDINDFFIFLQEFEAGC